MASTLNICKAGDNVVKAVMGKEKDCKSKVNERKSPRTGTFPTEDKGHCVRSNFLDSAISKKLQRMSVPSLRMQRQTPKTGRKL